MNAKNRECCRTLLLYALVEHIALEYVWFTIQFFVKWNNFLVSPEEKMEVLETYENFRKSIILGRQLIKEYDETHDQKVLEYLQIVKQNILDLLQKMESFDSLE